MLVFLSMFCCSNYDEIKQIMLPERIDKFSINFIKLLNLGELEEAQRFLMEKSKGKITEFHIQEAAAMMLDEKIKDISVISIKFYEYDEYIEYKAKYQIRYLMHSQMVLIELIDKKDNIYVKNFEIENISISKEKSYGYSLNNISFKHYIFATLTLVYIAIIAIALLICLKSRLRNKWKALFAIVILLGIVRFSFSWSTGDWAFQLLSVGITLPIFKSTTHTPLVLSFFIPLGALVFLSKKNKINEKFSAKPNERTGTSVNK